MYGIVSRQANMQGFRPKYDKISKFFAKKGFNDKKPSSKTQKSYKTGSLLSLSSICGPSIFNCSALSLFCSASFSACSFSNASLSL